MKSDILVVTIPFTPNYRFSRGKLKPTVGGAERVNLKILNILDKGYELSLKIPISIFRRIPHDFWEDAISLISQIDSREASEVESLLRRCNELIKTNILDSILLEKICMRYREHTRGRVSLNLLASSPSCASLHEALSKDSKLTIGYIHSYVYLYGMSEFGYQGSFPNVAPHEVRVLARNILNPKKRNPVEITYSVYRRHYLKNYWKKLHKVYLPSPGGLSIMNFLDPSKVIIMPSCDIIDVPKSANVNDEYVVFGSSRAEPAKGIFDVLLSWKLMKPRVPLYLFLSFDNKEQEDRFREFLETNKIDDNVILKEPLPRQEYLEVVRKANAIVLPSYYDSCSLSLQEALALGKNVIFYDYLPVESNLKRLGRRFNNSECIKSVKIGKYIDLGYRAEEDNCEKAPDEEIINMLNEEFIDSIIRPIEEGLS